MGPEPNGQLLSDATLGVAEREVAEHCQLSA
jgi:hypothetical protein